MTTTEPADGSHRPEVRRGRSGERDRKLARRVTLWSAAVTAFMGIWGVTGVNRPPADPEMRAASDIAAQRQEQTAIQPVKKSVVVVRRVVPAAEAAPVASAGTRGGSRVSASRPSGGGSAPRPAAKPAPVTRSRGS